MKSLKIIALLVLITACTANRKVTNLPTDVAHRPLATISFSNANEKVTDAKTVLLDAYLKNLDDREVSKTTTKPTTNNLTQPTNTPIEPKEVVETESIFQQNVEPVLTPEMAKLKQTVLGSQIATNASKFSDKELRTLNKMDKRLTKKMEKRADFEWTKTAKLVGIIAGAALILWVLSGWFFGLFIGVLGGAALLCKLLGVIDF